MSTETVSLTDLRPRLSEAVDRAHSRFDRFVITRRGRAEAVLFGSDDYQGLLETLDVLADEALVKRLLRAEEQVQAGETVDLDTLRDSLRPEAAETAGR